MNADLVVGSTSNDQGCINAEDSTSIPGFFFKLFFRVKLVIHIDLRFLCVVVCNSVWCVNIEYRTCEYIVLNVWMHNSVDIIAKHIAPEMCESRAFKMWIHSIWYVNIEFWMSECIIVLI